MLFAKEFVKIGHLLFQNIFRRKKLKLNYLREDIMSINDKYCMKL